MSAKDVVATAVDLVDKMVADKMSQLAALETKINAATETLRELNERIGEDLMPKLEWRKEFDALREKCRKFADS